MDAAKQRDVSRELQDKLIAYWHDVDFNWGLNAGSYYTEDAVFESGVVDPYVGRTQIEEFYAFRRDRGPRVVFHGVLNFHCTFESDTRANGDWICLLHAHDGERPQMTAPPINISLVKDIYVLENGEWLCKRRSWHTLFQGGAPATVMSRDERERRTAGKSS